MPTRTRILIIAIAICIAGAYPLLMLIGRIDVNRTISRLASKNPGELSAASAKLVSMGGKAVMPLIEALADDDGEKIRLEGVNVLSRLKDTRAIPLLVLMLEKAGAPEIRRACADAFVAIGTRDAAVMSNLLDSFQFDRDIGVRRASLTAFVKLSGDDATPQMITAVVKDRELRPTAIRLFQYHGDRRALPLLCRLLLPYNKDISENIARALGRQKDRRALPVLWSAWTAGEPAEFAAVTEKSIRRILGNDFTREKTKRMVESLADPAARERTKKMLLGSLPDSIVFLDKAKSSSDGEVAKQATKLLDTIYGMMRRESVRSSTAREIHTIRFEGSKAAGRSTSAKARLVDDEEKLKSRAPLLAGKRKIDFSREEVLVLEVVSAGAYSIQRLGPPEDPLEMTLRLEPQGSGRELHWFAYIIMNKDKSGSRITSLMMNIEGASPMDAKILKVAVE